MITGCLVRVNVWSVTDQHVEQVAIVLTAKAALLLPPSK